MKGLQLFICSAVLVTAYALTVETPIKDVEVARGKNATLHCNFNTNVFTNPGDFVVWKKLISADDAVTRYFDGLVQYGKGYENRIQFTGDVNSGDISITIKEVTMEDNGTYVCSVRLRDDPPRQSALTSLFVLIAPSKPECKIVGTAEYGQTINLTCFSHEGSPKPTYTWQSFNILNEPRVLQTTNAGEQITLKNISADTSGFYICTSTNSVGKEFCNMTVSVVPPSMNIALYAGIAGGVLAAVVVIGILAYCCCCRGDKDYEETAREDEDEHTQNIPMDTQRAKDASEDE